MNLDCANASRFGLEGGWVVFDEINGGIVSHDKREDCVFAWIAAAHKLADALTEIERTIHNTHPQMVDLRGNSG